MHHPISGSICIRWGIYIHTQVNERSNEQTFCFVQPHTAVQLFTKSTVLSLKAPAPGFHQGAHLKSCCSSSITGPRAVEGAKCSQWWEQQQGADNHSVLLEPPRFLSGWCLVNQNQNPQQLHSSLVTRSQDNHLSWVSRAVTQENAV